MISWLRAVSRLPVGSSASSTRGIGDNGARNGDALLLAAGELRRRMMFAALQADEMQGLDGPLAPLGLCGAAIDQRQFDILDGRGAVKRL